MRLSLLLLASLVTAATAAAGASAGEDAVDVAIVGAGYAGLTAARRLQAKGLRVRVFEATNRTGGRTFNHAFEGYPAEAVVELGGQWIGNSTSQPHAYKLIVEELGFNISYAGYDGVDGDGILYSMSGPSNGTRFPTKKGLLAAFHLLSAEVQSELREAWDKLGALAKSVDLSAPWTTPEAAQYDHMTFDTWISENVKSAESRRALRVLCTTMIAQEPYVVSFLHILFYIQAAESLENLVIGEQQYRVVGGTQAPPMQMAADIIQADPGAVLLSSPVVSITQDKDGALLGVRAAREGCLAGVQTATAAQACPTELQYVRSKHVILTGPPPILNRIWFDPPLPYEKAQLFERLPLGNSVKLMVAYKTPFWHDLNLSGTVLASTTFRGVLFSNCFDNSPVSSGEAGGQIPGVMLCFCEGECSEIVMAMPSQERQELLTDYLAESFGERAKHPFAFLQFHWAAQPFSGGAYSSYFPTGVWTQQGRALREPRTVGSSTLYWAGADYATDGNGYINGAVGSAESTAALVLERLRSGANGGKQ